MHQSPETAEFRWIEADETLPLRSRLLRNGAPQAECRFSEDSLPEAQHGGAYLQGRLVAILSLYPAPLADLPGSWQLRGMAVEADCQGAGIGRGLLHFAEKALASRGIACLWCNARITAIAFYQRNGWIVISSEFLIPDVGPHVRMCRKLEAANI